MHSYEDIHINDIGDSCGVVFHYTSLSNAVNIITDKGILFHASRYDSMNDPNDSVYAIHLVDRFLEEREMAGFVDTYDANISSYLVSFSLDNDKPLMWRLYNADVTLHIDSDTVRNYCLGKTRNILMNTVEYLSEDDAVHKSIKQLRVAENIVGGDPLLEFQAKASISFLKHPDFEFENEWRVACFDNIDVIGNTEIDCLTEDDVCSAIKKKESKYGLRFYREMLFPKNCLKGITIKSYSADDFNSKYCQLRLWLATCGYNLNEIEINRTNTAQIR